MPSELNYIKNRLDDQINWYSGKANQNKARYHGSQVLIIIAAALIPVINIIDFAPIETRIFSTILAGTIIGAAGILQLKKFQENWILYRATEEILKKEKNMFENGAGEYSELADDQKHKLLVERVEAIILNQNYQYFGLHREKPPGGRTV